MISYREMMEPDLRSAICEGVLRALPDWFGVEASILEYAQSIRSQTAFAAWDGDKAIGFAALKPHTPYAQELCVMGVLQPYHRQGAGRELVGLCAERARAQGARFLTVKTVAELSPDPGYARTRAFYLAMGFYPLEVFKTLWDEENPCLLSVMLL